MILKAKERGDAAQLARYLLSTRDNEHVELHDVRGFISEDLLDAFHEADAIARGTRCKNHLFSMSLNPPEGAQVTAEGFEEAVRQIEEKIGLQDQSRAIVFHEKDGRRHAHVVWSRIDLDRMRAINLSHYKAKLRDVSRKLFLDHDWEMPRGLQDRSLRDPRTFTQAEWQQARRNDVDPREIKAVFQQAWKMSDNCASFAQALKEKGFWLAKGDRRGFVAVDYRGDVYAVSRYAGVKTKEIEAKLGNPKELQSVEQTKAKIAHGMTKTLEAFVKDVERDAKRRSASLDFRRADMKARHSQERTTLSDAQEKRWQAETNARAARLPKGMSGIWHRITGRYAKVKAQNEREAYDAYRRDRAEKDALIFRQLDERQVLQRDIRDHRTRRNDELLRLRADVSHYQSLDRTDWDRRPARNRDSDDTPKRKRSRNRRSRRDRGFEP